MARIGSNPARQKISGYRPARVTITVLTFIPELKGYFSQRFDVLKLTLDSIIANTSLPYDLLVFDNRSCEPVVDYLRDLRDKGTLDYLILSARNIGKIGALKLLFKAAPGEIIAFSDDDILFYPGWLEAHLKVMDVFPNVGMVSGLPVRNASERASETLKKYIVGDVPGLTVSHQRRIPDDWEVDWAVSTGRDPEEHLKATRDKKDLILELNDVEVLGSANHFQFVSPKEVLVNALTSEWGGQLMGQMVELDEAVDRQGYFRLSTLERYTRHIGNMISPQLANDVREMGLSVSVRRSERRENRHWILRVPGAGRLLWKLYDWLFRVLHGVN
jgi:glycosyltransferase involved in cell wall biosynthesis